MTYLTKRLSKFTPKVCDDIESCNEDTSTRLKFIKIFLNKITTKMCQNVVLNFPPDQPKILFNPWTGAIELFTVEPTRVEPTHRPQL
jgi:hypothetical protein